MNTNGTEANAKKSADLPVGYGNPPRDTRFKKGASGNPRGRPKGSRNIASVLAKTLRERVIINEGGQRKSVSKLEAAIKQLVNRGASGDLRALRQLVELARDAESKQQNTVGSETSVLNEIDQEVVAGILERFAVKGSKRSTDESKANGSDA